jgi:LPXTG-motif cell wall-anchored protein
VKKLAAVLALILTSFVVAPGLVAPANAADDDPYTAGTRTSCHIAVPAVVQVNHAPRIRITIRPNGPAPAAGTRGAAKRAEQPTGTVDVSITRGGTSIFSKSVAYNGAPITIFGPVITQPGHYVVHARFHAADGSVFKDCHNNTAFDVRKGNGPGPGPGPNPGNHNPGGLLPDTGGPNLLWLILGLALVGSGGGLVFAAKRRPNGPLYDVGGR